MVTFILRRLVSLVCVLFCVVTITFFLIRIAPGGPFDRERKLPPQIEKHLLAKYRLDLPVMQQYREYLWDVMHGDLRISFKYRNRTVNELLGQMMPVSMTLGGIAFVIATVAGIWVGSYAAVRHATPADTLAMLGALLAISIPTFVIGPLLILAFALKLDWLPVGGWGSVKCLILPSITLAGPYVGSISRGSCGRACSRCWGRISSARRGRRGSRTAEPSTNTRSRWRSCRWSRISARWRRIF